VTAFWRLVCRLRGGHVPGGQGSGGHRERCRWCDAERPVYFDLPPGPWTFQPAGPWTAR
jgi:hypothetical protein